ncbi:MAG: TIR domain-containing protein [Armatimonadota bacterium]
MATATHRLVDVSPQIRNRVFISYSHEDRPWLQKLRPYLKDLERGHGLAIWDDSRIQPGSDWPSEIERALREAKVAVLLVSQPFLASDFIIDNELPSLLAAAREEGTVILPLIVSPCTIVAHPEIYRFQAVNSPEETLEDMDEARRKRLFVKLAESIKAAMVAPVKERPPLHRDPLGIVEEAARKALGKRPDETLTPWDWSALHELDLSYSQTGDAGLQPLASSTALKSLFLSGNGIGDTGLARIAQLVELEYLDLSKNCAVSDAALHHLGALKHLKHLDLSHTAVSGTGLTYLRELSGLCELLLRGTRVDDAGLSNLQAFPRLCKLDLQGTLISDGALSSLESLARLEYLGLRQTNISRAGKERLRHSMARCRILG